MAGRPRTPIGTYGNVGVTRRGDHYVARTRYRDRDGKLRAVTASGPSPVAARSELTQRLLDRRGYGSGSLLHSSSRFTELAALWLDDLKTQDLAEGTKTNYRDILRFHVLPAFENFLLREITTSRVEWFLRTESNVSYSRAMHGRQLLNLLFKFAMRGDAMSVNPVDATSRLRKLTRIPEPLSAGQIAAIRAAMATWTAEYGSTGATPESQVRDIVELLIGTGLRIGEALGLRYCDLDDAPGGMILQVRGTVVESNGPPYRQDHPKTEHSVRAIVVPDFVAEVLRPRLATLHQPEWTVFAAVTGRPLGPAAIRRAFRGILKRAGLEDTEISLRSFRRTVAFVLTQNLGADAAASYLGHSSATIVKEHYVGPNRVINLALVRPIEKVLRRDP